MHTEQIDVPWKYKRNFLQQDMGGSIILESPVLHETNNHSHLGNAVSSEIRIFEEKIRDRAVNYNESTQTVIDNCLINLSDNAVARIPNFKHIKNCERL